MKFYEGLEWSQISFSNRRSGFNTFPKLRSSTLFDLYSGKQNFCISYGERKFNLFFIIKFFDSQFYETYLQFFSRITFNMSI